MIKTFFKSYIIQPLELSLDYIVLNYCFLETSRFTFAEDNFIRGNILRDRKLNAPNITVQLKQSPKKISQHPLKMLTLCETDLYSRIAV